MKTVSKNYWIGFTIFAWMALSAAEPPADLYETRVIHDPNGIGKFYMGREIAQVMGHQGADWLERPERQVEEKPDELIKALAFKAGESVADVGAGSGYLSAPIARLVGTNGIVFAVEIQQEMLDLLIPKMSSQGITNITPVLGTISDTKLPKGAVDTVLMVDVYHEFSHPYEMMRSICSSLKKNGRVVFVEYRAEDPEVPIKAVHKMSVTQVRKEAENMPLKWEKTIENLPRQHIIIFRKMDDPGH
ncbi:MAG: Methyltransferase type 11 [Verrucomicrobiales bacterium]|nr:Methyltransferase type 11 [Verrucomicrobiales bacterium]